MWFAEQADKLNSKSFPVSAQHHVFNLRQQFHGEIHIQPKQAHYTAQSVLHEVS